MSLTARATPDTFTSMPHGFFIVEQFSRANRGARPHWAPVRQFDARHTLTQVMDWIAAEGMPGLYRVLKMQRIIWAEESAGRLRLKKWHAGSPETLERTAAAYLRDGGKYANVTRTRKRKARSPRRTSA
jgi:hypothetical protein